MTAMLDPSAAATDHPLMGERGGEWRGWMRDVASSPWPWLAYLPMFGIPWLFAAPGHAQLAWAAAGIALFLALYIGTWRVARAALLPAGWAVLLLAFGLAFTGGNWTVIAIYAAAMAGEARPSRHAGLAVAAMCVVATLFALSFGTPWFWAAVGVFMMAMVGLGSISRAALEDKNTALAAARGEVQRLAATAERERIGRDLHDLLGRTLTLVAIKAELAAKLASRDAARAEAEMREVAEAARDALAEVRAAVTGMTGAGLAREVEQSRAALAAAGIACEVDGDPAAVSGDAGAVLAMALREAVTNVIRHSGARGCTIRIDAAEAAVTVADDGHGAAVREGGGIGGIRARLSAAGGQLSVEGGPGGTRLVASMARAA